MQYRQAVFWYFSKWKKTSIFTDINIALNKVDRENEGRDINPAIFSRDRAADRQHDTFQFDKAWKNEIWHCYQSLSFDLKHSDSIKDKVYKWSERIREIKTSDEKIDLTFLASISLKHKDLSTFINDTLLEESENISVNIVYDDHVESFAKNLLDEMNNHQE